MKDDGLFGTASISLERTGLPFVVWISAKAGASHDVRVKVSKGPKVHSNELVSVAIRPYVHVIGGGEVTAHDLALLTQWVELNGEVIMGYWDGEIESPHWHLPGMPSDSGTPTEWLSELPGRIVHVYCDCRTEVAAVRFCRRKRHPGHEDHKRSHEEILVSIRQVEGLHDLNIGSRVDVDTLQTPDLALVVRQIQTICSAR